MINLVKLERLHIFNCDDVLIPIKMLSIRGLHISY
jgi:hypothetical protein